MAIKTLAGVNAGLLPAFHFTKSSPSTNIATLFSFFYFGSLPPAATPDTTTANGVALSSSSAQVTGQIPFFDPSTGNMYLAAFKAWYTNSTGTYYLCDRLWHCGAISAGTAIDVTATSSQTINSATWPARDENGSTNGQGVLIGLEIGVAVGAGTPIPTITYTASDGTSGRTATPTAATFASAKKGDFLQFGLQAGDVGVRSIQSYQQDVTWTSGNVILVAYRVIASLAVVPSFGAESVVDALTSGFPRFFNGSVPFLVALSTASTINAPPMLVQFTQG